MLFPITREARLGPANRYTVCKDARQKSKPVKRFCKIINGFLELFISNGPQGVSCLSALDAPSARANPNSGSLADVGIWPEVRTSKALRDRQKSQAEVMAITRDMIAERKLVMQDR